MHLRGTASVAIECYQPWTLIWYISEVFVIVSLTLFLPICLEQFARDNGFFLPERTKPCMSPPNNANLSESEGRCVVRVGWVWIDSASFRWVSIAPSKHTLNKRFSSLYVYSISVALQALTVISMGSIADHRARIILYLILRFLSDNIPSTSS